MTEDISLYIHIPFCKSKCAYCDFCSSPDTSRASEYADELKRRIKRISSLIADKQVASVYFGGGTPTVAGADVLSELLGCISSNHRLAENCEITAEANPGTVGLQGLRTLKKAGFNRISAGVQTALDSELAALGRTSHTFRDAVTLVENVRAAGFDNINLDLMYGIPDQTRESFDKSISAVIALSPEHISAYALRLEEGTPLYAKRDCPGIPDGDTCADMYLRLNKTLSQSGYERYEISNFAKPGYESRHNLRYWEGGDYIGIGLSAASLYCGARYRETSDMDGFLSGKEPELVEKLGEGDKKLEYLMLRLRLGRGICKSEYGAVFGEDFDTVFKKQIEKYVNSGHAVNGPDRFYLTASGAFISNAVILDFIY